MRKVSGVICLCCISVLAIGQTEQADSTKNHIGFNTSFLVSSIFQSSPNASPFTMMYKRQVKKNQALRLGASTQLFFEDSQPISNTSITRVNQSVLKLSLGEEFQRKLTRYWTWYGGGDIIAGYSRETIESPGSTTPKKTETAYSGALRPFLGIRFDINSRLYLSAEASLSFEYSNSKSSRTEMFSTPSGGIGIETSYTRNRFTILTSPAAGIFFFYRF